MDNALPKCKDCRKSNNSGGSCYRKIVLETDYSTGNLTLRGAPATSLERGRYGECGKRGIYFEPGKFKEEDAQRGDMGTPDHICIDCKHCVSSGSSLNGGRACELTRKPGEIDYSTGETKEGSMEDCYYERWLSTRCGRKGRLFVQRDPLPQILSRIEIFIKKLIS